VWFWSKLLSPSKKEALPLARSTKNKALPAPCTIPEQTCWPPSNGVHQSLFSKAGRRGEAEETAAAVLGAAAATVTAANPSAVTAVIAATLAARSGRATRMTRVRHVRRPRGPPTALLPPCRTPAPPTRPQRGGPSLPRQPRLRSAWHRGGDATVTTAAGGQGTRADAATPWAASPVPQAAATRAVTAG